MPKVVFNPMLKKGFQEINDASAEIARVEAKVTTVETLLQYLTKDNDGNYIISIPTKFLGNVTVQGTQTIIKTQQIESENDFIILRDGNPLGLAAGAYSGFKIKNYDGNGNNCLLVVDKDGWARVGDENGTAQKIATIQENPTNGALVKYNTSTKQLESTTINNATQSAAGLMSAADKTKLDNIPTSGNYVKKFNDTEAALLNDGDVAQYQGESTTDLVSNLFYKKTIENDTIPAGDPYVQNQNNVNIGGFAIPPAYYTPVETLNIDCYGYFKSEQYSAGQWYIYTTFYPAVVGQKVCVTKSSNNEFVKFVEIATVEQAQGQTWNIPATYSDGLTVQNQLAMIPHTDGKLRKYQSFNGDIMVLGVYPDTQGAPFINVGFLFCGIDENDVIFPLISTGIAEKSAQSAINIPHTILTQTDVQPQPPLATTETAGLISAADKAKLDELSVSNVTTYTKSNSTFKFYKCGRIVNVFMVLNVTGSAPIPLTIDAAFAPIENVYSYGVPFMSSGNCSIEITGTTLNFIGKGGICLSYIAAS